MLLPALTAPGFAAPKAAVRRAGRTPDVRLRIAVPPLVLGQPGAGRPGSGGVGMVLDGSKGRVVVGRVVPGGPAAKAGVMAGDEVLGVDDWKVPALPKSADVAKRVRGQAGQPVKLHLRRADVSKPLTLTVVRGAMKSLFPAVVKQVLRVESGLALIATAERHVYGVAFPNGARTDQMIPYQWAIGPRGVALGHVDVRRGHGVIAWSRAGATIQVADWRLDLKPVSHDKFMIVGSSTRPLAVASQDTWLSRDPARADYVVPRPPRKPFLRTWPNGKCNLRLRVDVAGKRALNRRVAFLLRNRAGLSLPTASTLTDERGVARLALPGDTYDLTALHAARAGGRPDLFFESHVGGAPIKLSCRGNDADSGAIAVPLMAGGSEKARAGSATASASMFSHALVGKPLPVQRVRRWLGTSALPETLKGHVMLLYLWATWCGPCKRVSPIIAELDARMRGRGLVVVSASVDRDANALVDFAAGRMAGAAAVAWLGPAALEDLPIRGIPTAIVIDHQGVVRAVHTGTGMSLDAWQKLLIELLNKAKKAARR